MPRICAYCGSGDNLTREHIFPKSVLSRYGNDSLFTISDRSDTYFKSEPVVSDVCRHCNNVVLSNLDEEFVYIFDKYMRFPISPGDKAEIKFDYNHLLRFLLKVSFNSSRASIDGQVAANALSKYVPFIRGDAPSAHDIMLRLQIFTSAKKYNTETKLVEGLLEAYVLRNAKIPYAGPQSDSFLVRLIAFNSFWFYLIVPILDVSRLKQKYFLRGFEKWTVLSGIPLSRGNQNLVIPVEKTTYINQSVLAGMYRKDSADRN